MIAKESGTTTREVEDWFIDARHHTGWNSLQRRFFSNCREEMISAATQLFRPSTAPSGWEDRPSSEHTLSDIFREEFHRYEHRVQTLFDIPLKPTRGSHVAVVKDVEEEQRAPLRICFAYPSPSPDPEDRVCADTQETTPPAPPSPPQQQPLKRRKSPSWEDELLSTKRYKCVSSSVEGLPASIYPRLCDQPTYQPPSPSHLPSPALTIVELAGDSPIMPPLLDVFSPACATKKRKRQQLKDTPLPEEPAARRQRNTELRSVKNPASATLCLQERRKSPSLSYASSGQIMHFPQPDGPNASYLNPLLPLNGTPSSRDAIASKFSP